MGIGSAVAVGVSAISGARQAKASGKASVADIKQQGLATQKNIENRAEAVRFSQGISEQRLGDMDIALSDKMSQTGLESLKREAKLKAASAETGTSGASQQEAMQTVMVEQNFANAAIVRDFTVMKNETKMSMVADLLNFSNETESIIFGQPSAQSAGYQASAKAGQAFQSGFGTTYKLLGALGGGSQSTFGSSGGIERGHLGSNDLF